jgi:hypothetical protein
VAKSKSQPKRRGYDTGGLYGGPGISSSSLGDSISSGFQKTLGLASAAQSLGKYAKKPDPDGTGGAVGGDNPMARGGKIKHTSGPRIGKDDGLIPAQRGEYVVRKSAVKKLGTKVLNQVNKGKLPSGRGR